MEYLSAVDDENVSTCDINLAIIRCFADFRH